MGLGTLLLRIHPCRNCFFLQYLQETPLEKKRYQKNNLILTLKELDFDFETGKLSEEDYKSLRTKYEQKTVSILKELETLEQDWKEVQGVVDQKLKAEIES